jgi:outer membrane protein TolC
LSYGGNGGGLGSDIENFGDRMDFDAVAFWEVRNLGLGERRARDDAMSRVELARLRQVQVLDQVASDVAEAYAQVTERKAQIDLAETGVRAAQESHRRNTERILEGQGLPIETLQSIQALDQSRRQYLRAIADYNRAQFRLQRALGWPVGEPISTDEY